jgi:hypothetical protein
LPCFLFPIPVTWRISLPFPSLSLSCSLIPSSLLLAHNVNLSGTSPSSIKHYSLHFLASGVT